MKEMKKDYTCISFGGARLLPNFNLREWFFAAVLMLCVNSMNVYSAPLVTTTETLNLWDVTTQADDLVACYSSGKLDFRLTPLVDASTATFTLPLADGVMYVPGSLDDNYILTNADKIVNDVVSELDISDLTRPVFQLTTLAESGDEIYFSIQRSIDCPSMISGLSDSIIITNNGNIDSLSTNSYSITSPEVVLTNDIAKLTDVFVGGAYERVIYFKNGSDNSPADEIYIDVVYGTGVRLDSFIMNSEVLSPFDTISNPDQSTTYRLTISGDLLGADSILTKDEELNFTEYTTVITSSPSDVSYTVGWGVSPDALCGSETKRGEYSMQDGGALLDGSYGTLSGFSTWCDTLVLQMYYHNAGSAEVTNVLSTEVNSSPTYVMYDVELVLGSKTDASLGYYNSTLDALIDYSHFTIGGHNIIKDVYTPIEGFGGYSFNLKDFFTIDPDGAGTGLEDIDGDGYFDDLANGDVVCLDFKGKIKESVEDVSPTCLSLHPSVIFSEYGSIDRELQSEYIDFISGFPYTYLGDGSDISIMPANIDNASFDIELNYPISSITSSTLYLTDEGRYGYKLILPEGYSMVGDSVLFTKGNKMSPVSEDLVPYTSTPNADGTTTVLAYSISNEPGFMTLTVQGCSELTLNPEFAYEVALNADPLSECNPTITFVDAILTSRSTCPSPSDLLGFDLIEAPFVRRTDGCLGWTDESLTVRQSAENISDYDLSVALYLDTLSIESKGVQHADAIGSSLRLIVEDLNIPEGPLKPLSLDMIVKRGNDTIYNESIDASYVDSYIKNSSQYMDWDLTSAVSSSSISIEREDSVFAVSYYEVSSPALSATTDNCGEEMYFYNTLEGAYGDSLVAGILFIPEMRLISIGGFTGSETNFSDGCLTASQFYALSGNLYDKMFYVNEIRPTYLVTSLEMLIEETVDLVDMYVKNYAASSSLIDYTNIFDDLLIENDQSQDGVSGLQKITYTNRKFDGSALDLSEINSDVVMKPLIQVDNSDYSLMHWYSTRNTCKVDDLTKNQLIVKGIPYYYHNAGKVMTPEVLSELSRINDFSSDEIDPNDIHNDGIPEIQLINLSGDIHATKPIEEVKVRLTAFENDALYTWLAFPTLEENGLSVEYVVESATGDTIYANSSTGIFELSENGIPQNTSAIYNVFVSYTSCDVVQLDVYGGWNCSEFPTDINNNCGTIMTQVEIDPSPSAIELIYTTNHDKVDDFGDKLVYECFVNNKGAGYIVNNILTLNTPTGFDIDSLVVEYPRNSGQWQTLTNTGDLTYVYDVSEHDNYPTIGIPGVTDAIDVDDRAYNIKYYVSIECGFNSGSSHRIIAFADRFCGDVATGSGEVLISNALNVESVVDLGYNVSMTLFTPELSLMCGEGGTSMSGALHFISSSDSVIAADGYLEVEFPSGYTYSNSSLVLSRPTANHDGYDIVSSSREDVTMVNVNGFNVAKLYYPSDIYKSDSIFFEFQLEEDASQNANCGENTLQISANEVTKTSSDCPLDPVGTRAQEFIPVTVNDDVAPTIDCTVAGFEDLYLDQVAGSEEAIENWLAEMTGLLADNVVDNCTKDFTADKNVTHNYTTTSYIPECGDFDSATGFEVFFNVEDNCGNVATSCSRTIKVIYDTPEFSPSDDVDMYIHYGEIIELKVDATNADALSYQWEINTTGTWGDYDTNQENVVNTSVLSLDSVMYRLKMTPVGSTCTTYSNLFTVHQDFSVSYEDGIEDEILAVPAVEYYTSTEEIIVEPAISRTGYVFTGWLDVENNTLLPEGSSFTMPRANIVLVAQWTPIIVYSIEYYTQDVNDTTSFSLQEQETAQGITGDSVSANINTYTGYVRYAAHSNDLVEGVLSANSGLTLKVYYNIIRYTVTYEEQGGLDVNDTTGVLYGTTVSVPMVTRARYTFEGWYSNAEGTGDQFTDASIVVCDTVAYAQWSVTPLINGNERDTMYEDTQLTTVNVLENNIAEGDVLTLSDSITLNGGTIIYNSTDGNFEYTPVENYYGYDTITYQVCNEEGACVYDTLFITILPVNDAPVAVNDTVGTDEDESIIIPILDNDFDIDGVIVDVSTTGVAAPTQGSISLENDIITYTPNPDFFGLDSFQYIIEDNEGLRDTAWVFIEIYNTNIAPIAISDTAYTFRGKAVTFSIIANDGDEDGTLDPLSIDLDPDSVGHQQTYTVDDGYFELDSLGNITFTPNENFVGQVKVITYDICDDRGQVSNRVTITVTVLDVVHHITYDANGGTGAPVDTTGYYEFDDVIISDVIPVNGDYDFGGWEYGDSLYSTDDILSMPYADIILVAHWDSTAHTVFYDANNDNKGGAPDPASYFPGETVIVSDLIPNSATDAYTFIGWEYNGTTYFVGDTFEMPKEDVTLVGRWLFIPTVFTPNGDTEHEFFVLPWKDLYSNIDVQIFNRWGDLVYQNDNYDNTWDGVCTEGIFATGKKVPTGTYFYVIQLEGDSVPTPTLKGYVYIISADK